MNKDNKILFWAAAFLVLILGLYAGARTITTFSGIDGASAIKQVLIVPAPKLVPQSKIMVALGVSANSPIYEYNIKEMRANLLKIPEISDAAIKREPGGKMYVIISEKAAVAVWFDGKEHYPLSASGGVMEKRIDRVPQGSVVFSGGKPKDPAGVIKVLNKFPDVRRRMKTIEQVEGRRWNIYSKSGAKIMLPEGDLAAALARLDSLGVMDKKAALIDLRDPARILVKQ
ncbi:MAG: cell division protein FtsQ/DivIB [Rickettsiales bacterium]|jgi:cell division septal protein FtsQ|nr:cell division protein FtsQ/DivIB [Rickettsiales bacterium]